jgi:hypothetical protein
MSSPAPPWLGLAGELSDVEHYRAMTPEKRLECFVDVCELARTILEERQDRAEVLARNEPMPAEAERTWLRLVAEGKRARKAR